MEVENMSDLDTKIDLITKKCGFYFLETLALVKKIYYAWRGFDKSSFEAKMVPCRYHCFPYPKAYPGQNEAVDALVKGNEKIYTLCSPTGTGKTSVYLTALRELKDFGKKVMVILPRKDLQDQIVREYSQHFSQYGMKIRDLKRREEYCNKLVINSKGRVVAACRMKYRKCVGDKYLWFFKYNDREILYPCSDCPYNKHKELVLSEYIAGQALLLLNSGNYYLMYHKFRNKFELYPDVVVIDEADVFRQIVTEAVTLKTHWIELVDKHSKELSERGESAVEIINKVMNRGKLSQPELQKLLDVTGSAINLEIESLKKLLTVGENKEPSGEELKRFEELNDIIDSLESAHRRVTKFSSFPDKIFYYYDKGQLVVEAYLEIEELVNHIFRLVEKCIIVSATVLARNSRIVTYDVDFPFSKVIFLPIEKLTFWNVFTKNHDRERAFEILNTVFRQLIYPLGREVSVLFGADPMLPIPIFCGSMKFVELMGGVFEENGISKDRYLIHEEGKLRELVEKFKAGEYWFAAFAAGAEYGGNWYEFPFQCVLRMPYRDKENPREQALFEFLGKERWEWNYTWDALSRFIQACGRNARNPLSFAVTITPDIKVYEVYEKVKEEKPELIPEWFRKRVLIPRIDDSGRVVWYDDYGRPFSI
jgi:Rad3-related DNA helicase